MTEEAELRADGEVRDAVDVVPQDAAENPKGERVQTIVVLAGTQSVTAIATPAGDRVQGEEVQGEEVRVGDDRIGIGVGVGAMIGLAAGSRESAWKKSTTCWKRFWNASMNSKSDTKTKGRKRKNASAVVLAEEEAIETARFLLVVGVAEDVRSVSRKMKVRRTALEVVQGGDRVVAELVTIGIPRIP